MAIAREDGHKKDVEKKSKEPNRSAYPQWKML
jgi:hypothetical protein